MTSPHKQRSGIIQKPTLPIIVATSGKLAAILKLYQFIHPINPLPSPPPRKQANHVKQGGCEFLF